MKSRRRAIDPTEFAAWRPFWLRTQLQRGLLQPIIMVYSVGKVGSTSITIALQDLQLPNPVLKAHFIADESVHEALRFYENAGLEVPLHVQDGPVLRQFIDETRTRVRWKLISPVREPVRRLISDMFETLEAEPRLQGLEGEGLAAGALRELHRRAEEFDERTDFTCRWFERELLGVFDFDAYAAAFEPAKGYGIFEADMADVLLLRVEDLDRVAAQAFEAFLGIRHFQVGRVRQASESAAGAAYESVLEAARFSEAALERIYASRYARKFYSDDERAALIRHWSRGR